VTDWHILTGEYPPQAGGVSDYTRTVARGLAASGDRVTVWAPPAVGADAADEGVTVRRLPSHFGPRSLAVLSRELTAGSGTRRLLVQYVPHAFGWKGANLPFCLWLRAFGLSGRMAIWVMFHEVAFPFDAEAPVRLNVLAALNAVMARLIGSTAGRAFVSIPAWRPTVESVTSPRTPVTWLPVPSAIPVVDDVQGSARIRAHYANGRSLIGHFGTYGAHTRLLLDDCLPALAARCDCSLLLIGPTSDAVAADLSARHASLDGRIHGLGALSPDDVSRSVSACDVMLQPYPDGISSRRTSVMTALSHARPVVTTTGPLTEAMWEASGAAVLVPVEDRPGLVEATASLATNESRRTRLSEQARLLYRDQFDVSRTIATLRSA
jgi:glycosyltransferase involved in cell wall biosynthesis